MITPKKRRIITYIIFFLLLADRMYGAVVQFLYEISMRIGTIPSWVNWLGKLVYPLIYSFVPALFVPIAIAIVLNQNDLQELNIDRPFIIIFLFIRV